MKRAVILIIDSLGCGAMDDAEQYGDAATCNTLANVSLFNKGLHIPNMQKLGIGNIIPVEGVAPVKNPAASFGMMLEASKGKDSTTGHWEIAGIVSEKGFDVYPQGFPAALMNAFVAKTGCGGYYGNLPASGTAIIDQFHQQHKQTGYPIIYTSADSVFQIACDVNVVPLEKLYAWCETARQLLDNGYNCSRVIARPYEEVNGKLNRLGAKRKDYSVPPPAGSLLDNIKSNGGRVVAIGKTEDIFVGCGITHSIHTGSNKEGLESTISVLKNEVKYADVALNGYSHFSNTPACELIFTNLVDTDMIYGHRRDAKGYGAALEQIDVYLGEILDQLNENDLLVITADHGCDPLAPGSDHTREKVPLLLYNKQLKQENLGSRSSFTYVARRVAGWLGVPANADWTN